MFKVVFPIHKSFFVIVNNKNDFKILNSFEELKKYNDNEKSYENNVFVFDLEENRFFYEEKFSYKNFIFFDSFSEKQKNIFFNVKNVILKNNFEEYKNFIFSFYADKVNSYDVVDDTIIRLNNLIDDYKKNFNRLGLRFYQLLDLFLPELVRNVRDFEVLAKIFLNKEYDEKNFLLKKSIPKDLEETLLFLAEKILEEKNNILLLEEKLKFILEKNYPNFSYIATYKIAAKLLSLAGSFENIAFMPSSRIQILGAEKALFRHLKNKKFDPPKYGVLHEHSFMSKVKSKNHGKLARLLADKISIAAKIDYFNKKEKNKKNEDKNSNNVSNTVKKYYDFIVKKVEEYSK